MPIRPKKNCCNRWRNFWVRSSICSLQHISGDLFEAENRLGGHARTVFAGNNGNQAVDTGFIVFNYPNYPELSQLFSELNVPIAKSDMSFGASLKDGTIEYALRNFDAIFAQRKMFKSRFVKMVWDINRFNTFGLTVADDESLTIGQFLKRLKTGDWFREYYLLPLSGAIWSTPTEKILDFPAYAMLQFLKTMRYLVEVVSTNGIRSKEDQENTLTDLKKFWHKSGLKLELKLRLRL